MRRKREGARKKLLFSETVIRVRTRLTLGGRNTLFREPSGFGSVNQGKINALFFVSHTSMTALPMVDFLRKCFSQGTLRGTATGLRLPACRPPVRKCCRGVFKGEGRVRGHHEVRWPTEKGSLQWRLQLETLPTPPFGSRVKL